jgi:hypothetical protein
MFLKLLEKHINTGILHLHLPGGDYTFGKSGIEAHWHVTDQSVLGRIARDWEFELGRTYMQGAWHAGSTMPPASEAHGVKLFQSIVMPAYSFEQKSLYNTFITASACVLSTQ